MNQIVTVSLLLTVLTVLLSSLISAAGRYNRSTMEPFLGKPVTAVIAAWGTPTTVYDEGEYKVYVWHSTRTFGGVSYTTGNQTYSSPVSTVHKYGKYWVKPDGTCAKYTFGKER